MSTNPNNANQAPTHRINIGAITVAIWERPGQYGPMHSATMQRSYRRPAQDGEVPGDDGRVADRTSSLSPETMSDAAEAIRAARAWCAARVNMWRREKAEAQQARNAEEAPATPKATFRTPQERDFVTIQLPGGGTATVDHDAAAYIAAMEERLAEEIDPAHRRNGGGVRNAA